MKSASADAPLTVSVVPDVSGLDRRFDYLVPDHLRDLVAVGSLVRVPLHGRRVGGWVVRVGEPPASIEPGRLLPLAGWSSVGPSAELVELAEWAAHRWAAGRLRPLLVTASPKRMVRRLGEGRAVRRNPTPDPVGLGRLLADGGGVLRTQPTDDAAAAVADVYGTGPVLVVHPSVDMARRVADRLRRAGRSVALWPDDWDRAASGGAEFVVGARSAVWATIADLAAVVVLDEHDEALQEERAPTWHARDVAIERCRRLGVPCALVSPCPTVTALAWAGRRWMRPATGAAADGWPRIEVIDRRVDEPWRRSLVSSELIEVLRDRRLVVACVHNVPGRARLLACRTCRELVVCEHCAAAVRQLDDGQLACRRCGVTRPPVCQGCGSTALANVRPGISRLREELSAAAGRPVTVMSGASGEAVDPAAAGVVVGTEAVLHRMPRADVVALLDFDAELLAPRYRAAEQALALAVRAARLVGDQRRGGRLLVQTSLPNHEVIRALDTADVGVVARAEAARRRALGLPPFGALAALEGEGAVQFADGLDLPTARDGAGILVRATDWGRLADALGAAPRPTAPLRIEVDPPRR